MFTNIHVGIRREGHAREQEWEGWQEGGEEGGGDFVEVVESFSEPVVVNSLEFTTIAPTLLLGISWWCPRGSLEDLPVVFGSGSSSASAKGISPYSWSLETALS